MKIHLSLTAPTTRHLTEQVCVRKPTAGRFEWMNGKVRTVTRGEQQTLCN